MGDNNGSRRRPEQACVARVGRTRSYQQGVVYVRSGADGNGNGQTEKVCNMHKLL